MQFVTYTPAGTETATLAGDFGHTPHQCAEHIRCRDNVKHEHSLFPLNGFAVQ